MTTTSAMRSWRDVASWGVLLLLALVAGWVLFSQQSLPSHDMSDDGTQVKDRDGGPTLSGIEPAQGVTRRIVPAAPPPDEGGVAVGPLGHVKGVVYSPGGTPVSGASVWLVANSEGRETLSVPVETGEDGTFSSAAPAHPLSEIRVRATGFMPLDAPAATDVATRRQELFLEAGASIAGTVVDELGRGVGGVRVVAYHPANRTAWPHPGSLAVRGMLGSGTTTISDASGTFMLSGLSASQSYCVRAAPDGCLTCWGEIPTYVAGELEARVVVRRLARVNVSVADERNQRDLIGVASVRLGYDGPCRHCPVPPGMPETLKSANGGAARCFYVAAPDPDPKVASEPPESVDISVTAGAPGYAPETTKVRLTFGRESKVEVRLVPSGAPPLPVAVEISSRHGTDYHGVIGLKVGGVAIWPAINEGRAPEPLYLPAGAFELRVPGGGATGRWLRGAVTPVRGVVSANEGDRRIRVVLNAVPVPVAAHAPGGGRLVDFDLFVRSASGARGRGMSTGWASLARTEQAKQSHEDPVVWLPVGEWEVIAHAAGVGIGTSRVKITGARREHALVRVDLVAR